MARDVKRSSRAELHEKAERQGKAMEGIHMSIKEVVDDKDVLRKLGIELDWGGGTSDAMEEIEKSLDSADRAADTEFDERADNLEQEHNESRDFQQEVTELGNAAERNLGRLSELTRFLKTMEVSDETVDAKDAGIRDVEELHRQEDDIRGVREASETAAEDLRRRMEG